jgi:multiple sugar transport system permease protein
MITAPVAESMPFFEPIAGNVDAAKRVVLEAEQNKAIAEAVARNNVVEGKLDQIKESCEDFKNRIIPESIWLGMWNSFKVASLGTLFSLLFCSMCGYALAVYKFKGSNVIFGFMIGSMMIPPILSLIPYFLIINAIGLMNYHVAVWLPFSIAPIGIFLIRQYVSASIPKDLLESAKLDGAGEFRIYFTIVLPLLKPALATLAIIQFVMIWNNFLQPLVILSGDQTVAILQVKSMQCIGCDKPQGAVMMASFVSMLPLIAVFIVASKQMISGLTSGAVK